MDTTDTWVAFSGNLEPDVTTLAPTQAKGVSDNPVPWVFISGLDKANCKHSVVNINAAAQVIVYTAFV